MDVEFKLFGSLTFKQFGSLAGCFLVALFIYLIKLPEIIGFPLIGLFVFLGLGFAFFTVQGQSFDTWLISFIIATLTPQRLIWKKTSRVPDALVQNFDMPKVERRHGFTSHDLLTETILDKVLLSDVDEKVSRYEDGMLSNIDRYLGSEKADNKVIHESQNIELPDTGEPEKHKVPSTDVIDRVNPIEDIGMTKQVEKLDDDTIVFADQPNLIWGKVLDKSENICPNVDVFIFDQNRRPIRRAKTNNQGNFYIGTRLPNGTYFILASFEGMKFQETSILLSGIPVQSVTIKQL